MKEKLFNNSDLEVKPLEEAETIPSSWCYDRKIYNFEINNLLKNHWHLVSHVSKLNSVGSYVVENLYGNSIIIIRSDEKTISAYYNVCKHRGGPLATENGSCKIFRCQYHGWTYKLDGSLRGTPKFEGVKNFNRNNYSLKKLPILFWNGLIFISINKPELTGESLFKNIRQKLSDIKINEMKFYKRINYEINCNWKVYVDNYLEGYHLPYVHPGLSKVLKTNEYKIEAGDYYSLQYSSLQDDKIYGSGNAFYYFIFPNIMLNILPGRLQTNLVLPLSENKTLVVFDYYYDDISSDTSNKRIDEDIRFSDEIQKEDISICEQVQKGLESAGYDCGRFSVSEEMAVHHFQSLLKKNISHVIN